METKETNISFERVLRAIESHEDEDDIFFLNALQSEDEYVVWGAIKGCGLKRIRDSIPTLVDLLGRPCRDLGGTDIRRIAAWSLSQMGYDSFSHYLIGVDESSNQLLREGAADALGLTGDPRALPILDKLMGDDDYSVLLWTSLSLSKLGEVSLPCIRRHLFRAHDLRTAMYLLDALEKIGTAHAKEVVQEYIATTKFEEIARERTSFLES